ncbi:MAG: 50S ribosomal protein L33 [Myxococcota bacterium]|nr:50S ribosomal protein L33 [Myxococcota bacterium]
MAKGNRVTIHLECTGCAKSGVPGVSRYTTQKNKRTTTDKLELRKYCRYERKTTVHKEIKS